MGSDERPQRENGWFESDEFFSGYGRQDGLSIAINEFDLSRLGLQEKFSKIGLLRQLSPLILSTCPSPMHISECWNVLKGEMGDH